MALWFVGGVMNILWIAALAVLVAVKKLAPRGEAIAKALGAVMIAATASGSRMSQKGGKRVLAERREWVG
jgi:predicted metal-binding membrane protein